MAAQANVVLTDGQPTPVSRTYSVRGVSAEKGGLLATWWDTSSGIFKAFGVLTSFFRPPTKQSDGTLVHLRLRLPTLEQTSPSTSTGYQPVPKEAYAHVFDGTFFLPSRGTQQERDDLAQQVKDLLAEAVIIAMVENLDPPT